MSQSEAINELSTALSAAQGAMKAAAYNQENPYFESRYADLAAVIDHIRRSQATATAGPMSRGTAL